MVPLFKVRKGDLVKLTDTTNRIYRNLCCAPHHRKDHPYYNTLLVVISEPFFEGEDRWLKLGIYNPMTMEYDSSLAYICFEKV